MKTILNESEAVNVQEPSRDKPFTWPHVYAYSPEHGPIRRELIFDGNGWRVSYKTKKRKTVFSTRSKVLDKALIRCIDFLNEHCCTWRQ